MPAVLNNLSFFFTNYILRKYDDTKTPLFHISAWFLMAKPIMCKRSTSFIKCIRVRSAITFAIFRDME